MTINDTVPDTITVRRRDFDNLAFALDQFYNTPATMRRDLISAVAGYGLLLIEGAGQT